MTATPDILALDFDGVICDGLKEYFQTTWRVYCQIWKPEDSTALKGLAEQFYRLRPVIETGWEMPVLLRAIVQQVPEEEILQNWVKIAAEIIAKDDVKAQELSEGVDRMRDDWIATDLPSWLAEHRLYPGVAEQLRQWMDQSLRMFIISTKEGRFIRQILHQENLILPEEQILGKEAKRPKAQILREILNHDRPNALWFVEDRLKTLHSVASQPELDSVGLFLADWGYNTEPERESARQDDRVHLISLTQFTGDFSSWV